MFAVTKILRGVELLKPLRKAGRHLVRNSPQTLTVLLHNGSGRDLGCGLLGRVQEAHVLQNQSR
jgi:hypothetical protein